MPSLLKEKLGYIDQHSSIEDAVNSIVKLLNGSSTNQAASSTTTSIGLFAQGTPTGTLSAAENLVTFTNLISDPQNAYSSGTYTVPENGYYSVNIKLSITCTAATVGKLFFTYLKKGGSDIATDLITASVGETYLSGKIGLSFYYLTQGEQLQVYSYTDTSSPSFASGFNGYFSIVKTGN